MCTVHRIPFDCEFLIEKCRNPGQYTYFTHIQWIPSIRTLKCRTKTVAESQSVWKTEFQPNGKLC